MRKNLCRPSRMPNLSIASLYFFDFEKGERTDPTMTISKYTKVNSLKEQQTS